jgi:hypothetical protein
MGHIRLAGGALLPGVVLLRELISLLYGRKIVFGTGFAHYVKQLGKFTGNCGSGDRNNSNLRSFYASLGSGHWGHTTILNQT